MTASDPALDRRLYRICRTAMSPDGLLRRHDYTVDILGGATGLNYASDYRDVDGIIVPTKRRVYAPSNSARLLAIDPARQRRRRRHFSAGADPMGWSRSHRQAGTGYRCS